MTASNTATAAIVQLPQWGTAAEAAEAYGIASRTLRLWAKQGKVERRGTGRNVRYRLPVEPLAATDAGMPLAVAATIPAMVATDAATDAATLRALLDEATRARIDAERRAAVSEYRAELAEVDPDEHQALREALAEVRAELEQTRHDRDEARAEASRLADAMRKRYALIQRLCERLANG